jgi:hypothetical protein
MSKRKAYDPEESVFAEMSKPKQRRVLRASQQKSLKARARRSQLIIPPEKKFYDTALTATNIPAPTDASGGEFDPSTTSMISTPAVGDGEQNRDGKQIICDSVEITGTLWCAAQKENATVIPPPQTLFLALVLDRQSNAAQMNSEDCFKNTAAAASTAATPVRNLLFNKRFKVLKQQIFTMPAPPLDSLGLTNTHSIPGQAVDFRWYIPLKNLKINFNAGTTASIVNVIDNSIHVIAYATTITPQYAINYNARLRFWG